MHLFSIKDRAESSRETEGERGDRGLGSTPSLHRNFAGEGYSLRGYIAVAVHKQDF